MKLAALLHSKLFIGIAAGAVAAATAVTSFVLLNKDEDYRVIKVFDKTGTSVVTRPNVGDLEPYVGMNLESGDTVCTFKESTMHMNLDDTKYLLLEPETEVELEASGNSKDNKTKIVLKSGSVLNEITEPLSSDSTYEVSAPKATMAVHGTSFRVTIEKDENGDYITKLYAFHGTVKVTLVDENGKDGQTAEVGKDKCVIIKTVKNEKTGKDASIDGTSFFVVYDAGGKLEKVKEGEDPTTAVDYNTIPYDTLKEVFTTDKEDEIKLSPEVLQKVIDAMNRKDEDTTTSGESTTPEETTSEPEETTSESEETSSPEDDPDETSTTTSADPDVTTVPVTTPSEETSTSSDEPEPDPDPETVKYTVKFYDYDGTLLTTQTVNDGEAALEPSTYAKSYTDSTTGSTMEFTGWDTKFNSVTSDLTIKPVYKAKARYTVKFCDYDGSLLSTQSIEEGMPAEQPSNYTKSYVSSGVHYTFRAWDNSYTNITEDLTVKPTYYKSYEVKFCDYDGTVLATQTIDEGGTATAPTTYSKSYTDSTTGSTMDFTGWDTDFENVTKPLTIKPLYKARTRYTVKFYDYDGSLLSTQSIEEGMPATQPANYTKTYAVSGVHYTFRAWDNSYTNITEDLTVKPTYNKSYEVKFFNGSEQIGTTQVVAEGEAATEPTDFEKEILINTGKKSQFDGWDKTFNKITAVTNVNAIFNTYYQVTFHDYDGSVLSGPTYVKANTAAKAPTNYTKTYVADRIHFTFTGWDTDFSKITKMTSVSPEYSESYEVRFFDFYNKQIGKTQIIAKGEDAVPPTVGTDFPETIETSDGDFGFTGWEGSYENIQESTDIFAVYKPALSYNLVIATGAAQTQTLNRAAVAGTEVTLPDASTYTHLENYNCGWFHSYSGLKPDTVSPITNYTIEEPGETFVLLNYVTVPMTTYAGSNRDPDIKEYTVSFYRHQSYNMLIMSSTSAEAVPLDSSSEKINGYALEEMRFNMKNGETLTYAEFVAQYDAVTNLKSVDAGYMYAVSGG